MIGYEEARRILLAAAPLLPTRTVPLEAACGAVAAARIDALHAVPGFANAAMDGYALRSADTAAAATSCPVRLPVAGFLPAGAASPGRIGAGAWEITTGAPLPPPLDAVVPFEKAVTEAGTVSITRPVVAGQNVRAAGEDFRQGDAVVTAGTQLAPHHLMGLAACGIGQVAVRAPARVGLLATGSELAGAGSELARGQIHDANGPYLRAMLPRLGASLTQSAMAPDTPTALRERLAELGADADLVLSTGGVSAGRLDLLPAVIRELGGTILFHKVAIRPGKPLLLARLPGGALLFGLPGNPLAVAVGMRFFVTPALRAMQGLPDEPVELAMLSEPVRGRGSLRFFAKALVETDSSGQRRVRLLPGQESFRIAPLIKANSWAIVPEDVDGLEAGALLATVPL